jgi:hypothetical protein
MIAAKNLGNIFMLTGPKVYINRLGTMPHEAEVTSSNLTFPSPLKANYLSKKNMVTGKLTCHNFLHLIGLCCFNFIGWSILCTKNLQVCTQVHIHMLCNHNKYVRKCVYKLICSQ